MLQTKGDLWDFWDQGYVVVVPTNRFVSPKGRAVMGRGVAKQAANKFPGLEQRYAKSLKKGHALVYYPDLRLLMFPVKPDRDENGGPGYKAKADLEMIRDNVKRLSKWQGGKVALPAVGCGFGELKFNVVLPILQELSDEFTLVLRDNSVEGKYPESFRPAARRDQTAWKGGTGYARQRNSRL